MKRACRNGGAEVSPEQGLRICQANRREEMSERKQKR
jgi:hypothetical protein